MKKACKEAVHICGAMFVIVMCAMIAVYALLGSARQSPVDMCDTVDERHGWAYAVASDSKARSFEPVFSADSYGMNALNEDCRAIKISRVMAEELGMAQLVFYVSEAGIEVALEDEILYSDFGTLTRDSCGYRTLDESDFTARLMEFRTLQFSLPAEYAGKTLSVVTYFPQTRAGARLPVYPVIEAEWASDSVVVEAVKPVTSATLCAAITLSLLVMLMIDGASGRGDWSLAFLAGYYFTLFLYRTYTSLPGVYSKLQAFWGFGIAEHIYPTFLFMALSTKLSGWRKWCLLSASCAQIAFTACVTAKNYALEGFIRSADDGKTAAALLIFTVILVIAERMRKKGRTNKRQCAKVAAVAVAVAVIYTPFRARQHDLPLPLYFQNIVDSAWEFGNLLPIMLPISAITAYASTILLVWSFISRSLDRQRAYFAIAERSRLTLEHYHSLLDFEERDKAFRHEVTHHLNATSAFLEAGEYERAREYVRRVSHQERDTRPTVYSRNLLVSAIVERYFQRAKAEGIACEARILIPTEVHIADEDLCVYLTNLLENALEACARCDGGEARHIRFTIEKQGNFIYIGCKNSARAEVIINDDGLPETTKKKPSGHGYGMLAMRRVAEKYNSALLIKQTPGEFSVMTNLMDQSSASLFCAKAIKSI